MFSSAVSLVVESLLHSPSHLTSFSPSAMTTEIFLCSLQLLFSMSPRALRIFKTRNVRITSEKSNRHENTNVRLTFGTRSVFYIDGFGAICETELTPLLQEGASLVKRLKKVRKLKPLQRWFCWTGSLREVLSSVSRAQRISSRCGAVKSVLCPKRLVTVERAPAIRGFLSGRPPGSQEHSHPAPPPAPIPALCSSLPSPQRPAKSWWGNLAKPSLTGRRGRRPRRSLGAAASGGRCLGCSVGGKRLRPRRFWIPGLTPLLSVSLRPRPPPTKPAGQRAGPQFPNAGLCGGAGRAARPEVQSPPLRPAPSVGLGPEGGSREGRWGPHPPSPSPFSARYKPGAAPAPAPSSPPKQTRPAEAKPLEKAPPSRWLPPDPKSARGLPLLPAATHAWWRAGRRRLRSILRRGRFPCPDVWILWTGEK